MIPVYEDIPKARFLDQLLSGAQNLSQSASTEIPKMFGQQQNKKRENEYLTELTGIDFSKIRDPEMRKLLMQGEIKKKQDKKDLEHTYGSILNEMEGLQEYVGYVPGLPWSEKSGKRSQIDNLRLSLEGLFRDLTLKGQFPKAIYERILKELPSAGDTKTQYLNKIEGIRKILKAHYGEGKLEKSAKTKETFDPSNPEHQAKARQLHKTYKDKEKVRKELKREFEGL